MIHTKKVVQLKTIDIEFSRSTLIKKDLKRNGSLFYRE